MTAVRTLYARCVCAVRVPCACREHAAATACAPKKRRGKFDILGVFRGDPKARTSVKNAVQTLWHRRLV